jgi:hypothetical protein
VVIVAGWRRCTVFTPQVADCANCRIERRGIFHREDHATSVLQVLRFVREANFPDRRLFTDPAALADWLDELLTIEEKVGLRALLGRTPA